MRRLLATGALCVVALGASASSAAAFSEIKIRAIFRGPVANSGFIELQMQQPGQNMISGQQLRIYPPNSAVFSAFNITQNVANGESQRTILIGDSATTVATPDIVFPGLSGSLNSLQAGGAACYGTFDCVSWGNFTGEGFLPSPSGTPMGPLLTSQVSARDITRGCATALDPADDTNVSSADFDLVVGFPARNNSTAPTEALCPTPAPPTKGKKCKKKKKGKAGAAAKKKCKKKKKRK